VGRRSTGKIGLGRVNIRIKKGSEGRKKKLG